MTQKGFGESECVACSYARKAKVDSFVGCAYFTPESLDEINKNLPRSIDVYEGWSYTNVRPEGEPKGTAAMVTSAQILIRRGTKGCKQWKA